MVLNWRHQLSSSLSFAVPSSKWKSGSQFAASLAVLISLPGRINYSFHSKSNIHSLSCTLVVQVVWIKVIKKYWRKQYFIGKIFGEENRKWVTLPAVFCYFFFWEILDCSLCNLKKLLVFKMLLKPVLLGCKLTVLHSTFAVCPTSLLYLVAASVSLSYCH